MVKWNHPNHVMSAQDMNYYERIRKSIDYIESHLEEEIDLRRAAQEAYMSPSSFSWLLFALVGHSVKEYIRLRRISLAARDLIHTDACVIDRLSMAFPAGMVFQGLSGVSPGLGFDGDFNHTGSIDLYMPIREKSLNT